MMEEEKSMRDAFFDELYDIAKVDRNVIVVSADMGAPALDKFRRDLKDQYVNTGIAEQNAMLVASGLALSGKKPYVYAIAPFVSTRIHEFAKLEMGLMKLPITIVAIGAGYSYDDSGPTHHNVEDISIMRAIPNIEILNPSDSIMAAAFARRTATSSTPSYLRLDRKNQRIKYSHDENFLKGYKEIVSGKGLGVFATGNMVDMGDEAIANINAKNPNLSLGLVDVYQLKPLNDGLKECIEKYEKIISLEEHLLDGGFGSLLSEFCIDNELEIKIKRIGVRDKYNYEYGGRSHIQKKMGIGMDRIVEEINNFR